MKIFYSFIFLTFFLTAHTVFAVALPDISTNCSISSVLRVGSRGVEVKCLQNKLGITADGKFGPMTKAIVQNFQANKGLKADGIVGPLFRAVFNSLRAAVQSPNIADNSPKIPSLGLNTGVANPNLAGLDHFIETETRIAKEQGYTPEKIERMVEAIRNTALNSGIDFNKEFMKVLEKEGKISLTQPPESIFSKILSKTLALLGANPSMAEAQIAVPFGGALGLPIPCTCNGEAAVPSFVIEIQPLPPSFATSLVYVAGTQKLSNNNLPFSRFILGTYVPTPGLCFIGVVPACTEVPNTGIVTPLVGSSL